MDRHVIANMGAELGATTTVFPSDDEVRRFLAPKSARTTGPSSLADDGATYDVDDEIDLSALEPLIAMPVLPGQRRAGARGGRRADLPGVIGSSANPGYATSQSRPAIVEGRQTHDGVSFDVNPTSRQILET